MSTERRRQWVEWVAVGITALGLLAGGSYGYGELNQRVKAIENDHELIQRIDRRLLKLTCELTPVHCDRE